uniref:Uncharacterized protein n=1 Tax=Knipowitschia caucasica TaxID=637954 RepID=A0AAV2M100_KNICA
MALRQFEEWLEKGKSLANDLAQQQLPMLVLAELRTMKIILKNMILSSILINWLTSLPPLMFPRQLKKNHLWYQSGQNGSNSWESK